MASRAPFLRRTRQRLLLCAVPPQRSADAGAGLVARRAPVVLRRPAGRPRHQPYNPCCLAGAARRGGTPRWTGVLATLQPSLSDRGRRARAQGGRHAVGPPVCAEGAGGRARARAAARARARARARGGLMRAAWRSLGRAALVLAGWARRACARVCLVAPLGAWRVMLV